MTDKSRIICSIIAFLFLALFVTVKYLPATWVLQMYITLTDRIVVATMIMLIPMVLYWSVTENDFGYALLLIIFMSGQVMFVHVYADDYQISISPKVERVNKIKVHYYDLNWNKA